MPTYQGIGVVWGISTGNITAGSGVLRQTGQTYTEEAEMIEHRNTAGEVIGLTHFNQTKTIELDVYPASPDSGTLANANSALVNMPAIGETVTLTDATDTDVAGAYTCTAASKTKSVTDKVAFRLTLKKYAGFTPGAPITS
jgi:hypothetical protein